MTAKSETMTLAMQIAEGTKGMVEKAGQEYKPIDLSIDEKPAPTEAECQQLSSSLVGQINEGTQKQKEYNAWYKEEYGTKNGHVSSNSVSF
jgi:hypothetical protein